MTSAVIGLPLAGVSVEAYRDPMSYLVTTTDALGNYAFTTLNPMTTYTVYAPSRFRTGPKDGDLVQQSIEVSLAADDDHHATINFVLNLGGSVTGTTTMSEGPPISAQVTVTAVDMTDRTQSSETGTYIIHGVPAGLCEVSGSVIGRPDTAYPNPVKVVAGKVTKGVNLVFDVGVILSGTTKDESDNPVGSGMIYARDLYGEQELSGGVDLDGTYTLYGLRAGTVY